MSGTFSDFDVTWYQTTGAQLLLTLLTQIFLPQATKIQKLVMTSSARCWDRKCSTNMFITRKVRRPQ